jgi:hypothetical protein
MVPRNTSVIVRRLPASRPGKGTAQRYVLGAMDNKAQSSVKLNNNQASSSTPAFTSSHRNLVLNNTQRPQHQPMPTDNTGEQQSNEATKDDSEEARIQAMFQQTTDQWGVMQERLAE